MKRNRRGVGSGRSRSVAAPNVGQIVSGLPGRMVPARSAPPDQIDQGESGLAAAPRSGGALVFVGECLSRPSRKEAEAAACGFCSDQVMLQQIREETRVRS
jgi:hypothetical protein